MKSSISEPCYILFGCFCFFTSISFFSLDFEALKEYDFLTDIRKEVAGNAIAQKQESIKAPDAREAMNENSEGLSYFFRCLDSLQRKKKQKIRIAHFGDSMIEGDLITGTLRDQFQQAFGGSGVGFVTATPGNPSYR